MRRVSRGSSAQVRASFWFYPAVGVGASLSVALLLLQVRPPADSSFAERAWPTDSSTASSLLQTVATASMTAASLTFSLTVVALQLASQQFSPRLLRDFARDRLIQTTVAVLVSTFVVSVTTLRALDPERPLPVLSLLLALLLALVSAFLLIGFIGHLVRVLRVDSMMAGVHKQTRQVIYQAYQAYEQGPADLHLELPGPEGGTLVPAARSGFVRTTDPAVLVETARRHGLFVRLGVRPGDQVVQGAPVATVWPLDGGDVDLAALRHQLLDGVALGYERTEEQDAGFGFRQLVDIAVKAISPGINDPTTAAEALGYCADLLVQLTGRRLGPQLKHDDGGRPRVVLPDRDLAYYLHLSCAQVRRYGRTEPAVLTAVLRLLRDVAVAARDDEQRRDVGEQVDLVQHQLDALPPEEMVESDADAVRDMLARARLALAGDTAAAYRDRSGETRSL